MQSIIIASAVEDKKIPASFSADSGCILMASEELDAPVTYSADSGCVIM